MTPAACPRCGSTNPAVRLHINILDPHDCDDEWHDRPSADPEAVLTKAFTQHGDNLDGWEQAR